MVRSQVILSFLFVMSVSPSVASYDVLATNPTLFIKSSQESVVANDTFTIDFYVEDIEDLYGFQLDIATSLKVGAIPVEPTNIEAPFALEGKSLFENDLVFINQFDSVKEITSLLVTKPLEATSGYNITGPTRIASLPLIALSSIENTTNEINLSDDLLSVQLGITNISVKLSTTNGTKILYTQRSPDIIQPVITIPQQPISRALNASFDPFSAFTVSDNESAIDALDVYVSNFHRLDEVGEYMIVIRVTDEFHNLGFAWFLLVVGDPYTNIEVRYGS